MMRKLLEAMTKFAGQPEQKPGEQWKGTDKGTPGNKLVGSADESVLKDLSKGVTPKTKEEELAEAFANFNEDDLGVEEKRPHRTGSRADKVGVRGHKEQPRYTTVKDEVDEATAAELKVGDHVTANTSKGEYPGGHKSRAGKVTRVGQTGVHIRPDDGGEVEYHPYKIVKKTVDETTEADFNRDEMFRKHDLETDDLGVVGMGGEFSAIAKAKKAKLAKQKELGEGWNNGTDRVQLADSTSAYWNGTGRLQAEYDELYNQLVPASGSAETLEGEVLRASSKIVYRHFNDGDLFNKASFDQLKPFIGAVASYDDLAEKAIEFALKAQGNYHPNAGWDSLDVMDYGPEEGEEYDDEEDDENDYQDWEDPNEDNLEEGANVSYTLLVGDPDTYEKKEIEVSALTSSHAREEAEAMGYKVFKVMDSHGDSLDEGMEEFAKSQAKQRAAKRKSIPWPKEVPTDAEQERNRTRDEEENDPHPYADTPDLDEGAADVYSITSERNGRERSKSATLAELIEYYGYTLETGKSYEHERGNRKINLNPKSIESLVQNLNNAKSNAAANGQSNERFYIDHGNMVDEGKWFKTQYGWAGGRNEKTGGTYKHPDQIKADREAKKAATAQQSKDAFNNMFGGDNPAKGLSIKEGIADTIKKGVKYVKRGLDGWDNEYTQDNPKALVKKNKAYSDKEIKVLRGDPTISTEFPHSPAGLQRKVLDREAKKRGMKEGWESGPEERTTRERDPDADYDARRQEKLDAEADLAPKTKSYQCVGRGPNNEPNYEFGPEFATQDEAVAYRKKLMANPKTPNPRDIGIRTISRVAKGINEDVSSTDPLEGALLNAIQELVSQGHKDVDPMVLTNMVVAATSRPFLLKDLVDANNNSLAVQHYIDSISPSKVKFSTDTLTVKNEDPSKDKAKSQAGVSSMASRAANRSRLGESAEISKQGFPDAFISLVYSDAGIGHDAQPEPMTKKPTTKDLAGRVIVVKGKDGNFYGARSTDRGGYIVYQLIAGESAKQSYVSSISEVSKMIKPGQYFAIPLSHNGYYKSRGKNRYEVGKDRTGSEYSAILKNMNNSFTPGIKQKVEAYVEDIYANLRKLSNEPKSAGYSSFSNSANSSEQEAAISIAGSLEKLVNQGFTRSTVDEYLSANNKRESGFNSYYQNIDSFVELMKQPLAQAKFAQMILVQAKRLHDKVKDMRYAPTVNALTNEGIETPLQDKEDYNAKRAALQQIQLDPDTAKDPQLKAELARRLGSLNQQYTDLQSKLREFKESRGHKAIATKLGNIDRMQNVQIPSPAERREQLRIAKEKEEVGKKQVKEFAAPGANPAPVTNATKPVVDPAAAQKVATATNTIKSATGSTVAAPVLATALDAASQGQANPAQVKAIAPIANVVDAATKDPKLAGQFKTLATQAQQSLKAQQKPQ